MEARLEVRLLVMILVVVCCTVSSALDLEAESGNYEGAGTLKYRTAASNDTTVLLHQGGHVAMSFMVFSSCTASVQNVAYTNDGPSDTITVTLDGTTVGSFQTLAESNFGHNWNIVRDSGSIGNSLNIVSGSHAIEIVATNTDQYGVEIDKVTLTFNEECIDAVECIAVPYSSAASENCDQGSIEQRSTETDCAEEDNIHVPIYFENIHRFNITATLPLYSNLTTTNHREADFTNCELTSRTIWIVGNEDTSSGEFASSCSNLSSAFNVQVQTSEVCGQLNNQNIHEIILTFNATGPSKGLVEAIIGSILTVQFAQVSGTLVVEAAVYGRASAWISLGTRSFTSSSLKSTWQIPDLTWEEGTNNISLSVTTNSSTGAAGFFDYIKQEMREEIGEYEIGDIYDDDITIVKAIGKDFWWLYPQAMVIRNTQTEEQLSNVIYIRVLRKVPGINSWPEVFVLYQDGNGRILTFPPSGIDWIPFGSSVIIGQSDPDAVRPYSAISQIDFDPTALSMTLHYANGGHAVLSINTDTLSTVVTVSDITYNTNTKLPFATFRSMWVSNGNADVDHVMSENGTLHIIDYSLSYLAGADFFFFRKCVSEHNTLSPDIRIEVQCIRSSSSSSLSILATSSFSPIIKTSTTSIKTSTTSSFSPIIKPSTTSSLLPTVRVTAAAPELAYANPLSLLVLSLAIVYSVSFY